MENHQIIKIEGVQYFIVDSIQNLRAEDSFIHPKNKLAMFDGAGEARKYIGSYNGDNGVRLSEFFDYHEWGKTKINGVRSYPIIQKNSCFFSKSNLVKYLYDCRIEYERQEQVYKNDISNFYHERISMVKELSNDRIFFSIYDVSDFFDSQNSRAYIRSDEDIWKFLRKLVLPKISYLSILKLLPLKSDNGSMKPMFYFRLLLDYQFRSIVHPRLSEKSLEINFGKKKKATGISTAREGQQQFRKKVIEHMPQCPFTKISDERLLIASHIKPYRTCIDENKVEEATDFFNGLALSPTYDKLFDQGYITFSNIGELICGTQLTAYTWERLKINPNAKNVMRIYPENREQYLQYHRQNVFQDDISDLI